MAHDFPSFGAPGSRRPSQRAEPAAGKSGDVKTFPALRISEGIYFRIIVLVNRLLNWLSPARKARRRAELRAMCEQMQAWLDSLPVLPEDK